MARTEGISRTRRWTPDEESEIRRAVAAATSLSIDDVAEPVAELLHRLVYVRSHPSPVLGAVTGEVRASASAAGPPWVRVIAPDANPSMSGARWLHVECCRLYAEGTIDHGARVRLTISTEPVVHDPLAGRTEKTA